jgi:hypothetical protein
VAIVTATPAEAARLLTAMDTPATDAASRNGTANHAKLSDSAYPAYPAYPTGWPEPLGADAMTGIVGELVALIDPHTEADLAGVLVQLLVGFGSMVGRHSHFTVGNDRHYANMFATLVGISSKGRKGSPLSMARAPLAIADPTWDRTCVQSGLSSGKD